MRAEVPVEVCRVEELDAPIDQARKAKRGRVIYPLKTVKPLSESNTNGNRRVVQRGHASKVNRARTVAPPDKRPKLSGKRAVLARMSVG